MTDHKPANVVHSDFIVPKIQPHELLAGYRGRIAAWNSCNGRLEVARGMAELYPSARRWVDTSMQLIEATAAANDMTPEQVLRQHTTYILRASSDRRDLLSLSGNARIYSQSNMALYAHNKKVWGCVACMQEDLKRLSFSYWRRDHQVPGRVVCRAHGSPLMAIRETQVLPGGPAQSESFIGSIQRSEPSFTVGAHCGEFTVAILDRMISTFHRPPHTLAVKAIRQGLEAQGINPSDAGRRKQLQAAIAEKFDPAWLESVAGKLGARRLTIAKKIERVLNPRVHCPAVDVAIVARLAFTDIGTALRAFGLQAEQPNLHRDCLPQVA